MKTAKAVVAAVAAVAGILVTVLSDDAIKADEITTMIVFVLSALGVYQVENE